MTNNLSMLGLALCMLPLPLHALTEQDLKQDHQTSREQDVRSAESIPAGTKIPVSLNSTLRPDKSVSRDVITATVMQDVTLSMGKTLRAGSSVTGHVVEVVPRGRGSDESKISFQFDQVRPDNLTIAITTNLRAASRTSATWSAAAA
jgi:hypothetical protein